MNTTDILRIEEVSKCYGKKEARVHALNRMSCSIRKNDITVILGPSGSGKSTFLHLIAGLDQADEGNIFFQDHNLSEMSTKQLLDYRRNHTGFIFQQYQLVPNLTVQENIEVGQYLNRNSLTLSVLIEELGLQGLENRFPHELSGGQQQRVAIARALIKKPDILFCDEITGALDEENSKQVLRILQRLQLTFSLTIVFVTHNQAVAELGNHIIKMNSGQLKEEFYNAEPLAADLIQWG